MKKEISYSTWDEAFETLRGARNIITAMAGSEPRRFYAELADRVQNMNLQGLRVFGANPSTPWPCIARDDMRGRVEFVVMFMTAAVRKLQGRGFVHYMPQHLSQWSKNIVGMDGGIDVFWGTCSKPDPRGFVSLGLNNCYESEVLRVAKRVVLEVNPLMPITYGTTQVALDEVDLFVEHSFAPPTLEPATFGPTEEAIAQFVSDLIPDGATLQLGIGGIPNAVGRALRGKKDLGIHTEMINDAMMDLYNLGVVNGRKKSIWPGKIVGAFAYGSNKLYEFIHENPLVEFHPASVVNDPYRIGRNHQMISLNTAVEIDLTGQVCSESVGHAELSGVGGASETHNGAQRSHGGRGIVAIPSTAKSGTVSKIVVALQPGAKVSISRNDIDTVVTEFGVARLKGCTVPERIKAMVQVAHPDHRTQLLSEAHRLSYI